MSFDILSICILHKKFVGTELHENKNKWVVNKKRAKNDEISNGKKIIDFDIDVCQCRQTMWWQENPLNFPPNFTYTLLEIGSSQHSIWIFHSTQCQIVIYRRLKFHPPHVNFTRKQHFLFLFFFLQSQIYLRLNSHTNWNIILIAAWHMTAHFVLKMNC